MGSREEKKGEMMIMKIEWEHGSKRGRGSKRRKKRGKGVTRPPLKNKKNGWLVSEPDVFDTGRVSIRHQQCVHFFMLPVKKSLSDYTEQP